MTKFFAGKEGATMQKADLKGVVRLIIDRLSDESKSKSVFLENVYLEASERGIGESYVKQALEQLKQENYFEEMFNSKLIRKTA